MVVKNLSTIRAAFREAKRVIRHGPKYPWLRYIAPTSIVNEVRIHTDESADVTVCVLTSRNDWLLCLWSLASFYVFSGLRLPLLIYSDGTLLEKHERSLASVFPKARILSSTAGETAVAKVLSDYPNCTTFRYALPYAKKIIDLPILGRSPFILVFDSDVIFLKRPVELMRFLESNQPGHFVFERDFQDAYFTTREDITKTFKIDIAPCVNTGIMLADVSEFDYSKLERWLGQPGMRVNNWAEQTLWAMYAGRERTEFLGKEYDVTVSPSIEPSTVAKHYIRPIRDFMYIEGIPYLQSLFEACGTLKG